MDGNILYSIIYALAASGGREAALFGECAPLAREAFARSLASDYFPELWFELPFIGEPWFDLHALAEREDLDPNATFSPDTCGGVPAVFKWFASQGHSARQLALSWDVGSGNIDSPAVQLLRRSVDTDLMCDFLAAADRADAAPAYRAFEQKLPKRWFACYTGVFPGRTTPFLRVECIPEPELQQAYATDPNLLAVHLRQVGFTDFGSTLLPRCQMLADMPFQLEFQFDVTPDGDADTTFSASVRFKSPGDGDENTIFTVDGPAGALMQQVEEWGLADDRWRLFEGATFSKRVSHGDKSRLLYCYPAFLKLRWTKGEQIDAKAYLIAGTQD